MQNQIAPLPSSLAPLLRRDGEWLRCAEPHCGDRAFWGAWRPADFLHVKVQAHRAKMHNGAAPAAQAGRPQRRNVAAAAAGIPAGWLVNVEALVGMMGVRLGQGVARAGFDLANVIVKRAHPGCEAHNRAEWQSYMTAPAAVRKFLCPPVALSPDGKLLLVRKATGFGMVTHADYEALLKALKPHGVHDLHLGNVAYLDGQVVATDYAQGMDGAVIKWVRP
jgi:hypothetical protein